MTTLKTGASCGPSWVLSMLADLEDGFVFEVVNAPNKAFVLKSGPTRLGGGVDSPTVRRGEVSDVPLFDKDG